MTDITTRKYSQELDRGVLTLAAQITPPTGVGSKNSAFLLLCTFAFVTSAASYAARVEELTAAHHNLKRAKAPIALEARFTWGTITGTLELSAHLCSQGVKIAKAIFAEEVPTLVQSIVDEGLRELFGQQLRHTHAIVVIRG